MEFFCSPNQLLMTRNASDNCAQDNEQQYSRTKNAEDLKEAGVHMLVYLAAELVENHENDDDVFYIESQRAACRTEIKQLVTLLL